MTNSTDKKQYRILLFTVAGAVLSLSASYELTSPANAEPIESPLVHSSVNVDGDARLIQVGDEERGYEGRGRYDYRDGRAAHEDREHGERDRTYTGYTHEDAERARRDYLHNEHEEHERRDHYGR